MIDSLTLPHVAPGSKMAASPVGLLLSWRCFFLAIVCTYTYLYAYKQGCCSPEIKNTDAFLCNVLLLSCRLKILMFSLQCIAAILEKFFPFNVFLQKV